MNNDNSKIFPFISIETLKSIEWRTKAFVWFISLGSVISVFIFWSLLLGFQILGQKKVVEEKVPKVNPFTSVTLEAKSAFVWDIVNKRPLFQKNADESLPLASLTKVMTVLTANSIAPNLNEVTIRADDLSPEGDSLLKVSSKWNVKSLIDYILLVSSNDGAHALAASAGTATLPVSESEVNSSKYGREKFINEMNKLAREIGMTNSVFYNEHGLDIAENRGGAYGSARDMALLFEYALTKYPHMLEATRYSGLKISDLTNDNYAASNTNTMINSLPSPIASKTGYTDLAGGNLVIAYDAGLGRPIVISVLGSTQEGRFKDVKSLVEASMQFIQNE